MFIPSPCSELFWSFRTKITANISARLIADALFQFLKGNLALIGALYQACEHCLFSLKTWTAGLRFTTLPAPTAKFCRVAIGLAGRALLRDAYACRRLLREASDSCRRLLSADACDRWCCC